MSWNLMIPAKTRTYLTAVAVVIGTSLSLSTGGVAQGSLIIPGDNYGIGSPSYQFGPWTSAGRWRTDRVPYAADLASPAHRRTARVNSRNATVGSAAR